MKINTIGKKAVAVNISALSCYDPESNEQPIVKYAGKEYLVRTAYGEIAYEQGDRAPKDVDITFYLVSLLKSGKRGKDFPVVRGCSVAGHNSAVQNIQGVGEIIEALAKACFEKVEALEIK